MKVSTQPLPFDDERQQMFDRLVQCLNPERMRTLLASLVDIHSPTGAERPAVEFMANYLANTVGVDTTYQPISEQTGNVYARVPARREDSANLLLYCPIDTHIDPEVDVPLVGRRLRDDMVPTARIDGDLVFGLGASNPKCMVAGLTEVVHAAVDAGIELDGELTVGFAGGGMPWTASTRDHVGMSTGVYHLLARGLYPDFCVLLKPRWGVFAEEPGIAWVRVSVRGTFGYAGFTRGTPGVRSSIVPAALVINELERWLPEYTATNTHGSVLPEAWISCVRGGDPDKPGFPSATTELFLDLRINPETTPGEVRHQFARFMADLLHRHPDLDVDWEFYGSIPGGRTDYDNWIIQSAQRGWEVEAGEPYLDMPHQAGQTDGAMIRTLGVPTARVGYPWPPATIPAEFSEGLGGMGVASIDDVMMGVRTVAYTVIDTLTRTRAELGLS